MGGGRKVSEQRRANILVRSSPRHVVTSCPWWTKARARFQVYDKLVRGVWASEGFVGALVVWCGVDMRGSMRRLCHRHRPLPPPPPAFASISPLVETSGRNRCLSRVRLVAPPRRRRNKQFVFRRRVSSFVNRKRCVSFHLCLDAQPSLLFSCCMRFISKTGCGGRSSCGA
ncbi:unnamed protein product [Hapterophycus canaliculatus]